MRPLKKNEKVGLGIAGVGVLGVIYLMGGKKETDIGGGGFAGSIGNGNDFPVFDEAITTKKDAAVDTSFSVFQPLKDAESTILPGIKDYDSWRESIKRPDPIPVKAKKEIVSTQKPVVSKISPVLDAVLSVTDPTLPIATTAAKLTVEKYVPAKKESIAKAKEIPVSNLTTMITKADDKCGFFCQIGRAMKTKEGKAILNKKTATPRQKTIALETAAKTTLYGPGAAINMLKAAGVKTPATKKQKIGALQTTAYTAAFGPGAGIASAINNAFNMPSTRKPKFSATAARYGGAAAGYGKYGKGYTTTKKGGAAVSRTSTGWSGGSTRDRMDTATKAGVYGLSYR